MAERNTSIEARTSFLVMLLMANFVLQACSRSSREQRPAFGPEDSALAMFALCGGQRQLAPWITGEPKQKALNYKPGTTDFEGRIADMTEALRARGGIVQVYDAAVDANDPTAKAGTATIMTLPDGRKVAVTNAHVIGGMTKPVIFSQHSGKDVVAAPVKICTTAHNQETDLDLAVMLLEEGALTDPPFEVAQDGCVDGGVMTFAGLPRGRQPNAAVAGNGYSTWVRYPNGCGLITGITDPAATVDQGDSGSPVLSNGLVEGIVYSGTGWLDAATVKEHTGTTFPNSPMDGYVLAYYAPADTVRAALDAAQETFGS